MLQISRERKFQGNKIAVRHHTSTDVHHKRYLSVEFCLEYVGKETLTVCTIRNKKIKEISDERSQSQRKKWIIRVFHKS